MDYYDFSCELDKISGKIECFKEMLGSLAECNTDAQVSGTYWFIHDTVRQYVIEIEALSAKAMMNHTEAQQSQTKKGKKK